LSPAETWKSLFDPQSDQHGAGVSEEELHDPNAMFRPSQRASHEEILHLLRENDKDAITIVAIGPLTNLARAAAEDPETFLKVKEVIVMGGCIEKTGNVRYPHHLSSRHLLPRPNTVFPRRRPYHSEQC